MSPDMQDDVPGAASPPIDEDSIRTLVHGFYAEIRRDSVLGPIFERAIGDHWDAHLAKLCDFWSSVVLKTGRFKGAPMQVHARLPDLQLAHFDRWLGLFRATAHRLCTPDAAALFIAKAEMIGASLRMGVAFARGEAPEVLVRPA
jgi:hemoglobin